MNLLDGAYSMGCMDYSEGKPMSASPFKAGSEYYKRWVEGWIDAVRADPLLDDDEKENLIGER